MFDLPLQTIAFYNALPTQAPQNFSHLSGPDFAKLASQFYQKGQAKAETDALVFYAFSHLLHGITAKFGPYQKLPDEVGEVCDFGLEASLDISARALFQLAAVVYPYVGSGVSALSGQHATVDTKKFSDHIQWKYPKDVVDFFHGASLGGKQKSSGWGGWGYDPHFKALQNFPGTIGHYFSFAHDVLAFSKMYAMPRWAAIAALGMQCVNGSLSLQNTADQTFSIQHYGGSVFNKGVFFQMPDEKTMFHVLDVQDSGQIFRWLAKNANHRAVNKDLQKLLTCAQKHMPEACQGAMDESLIKASEKKRLGKLGSAQFGFNPAMAGVVNLAPAQDLPRAAKIMKQQNDILLKGIAPPKP